MNYKKVSLPLILLLAASLAMAEVSGSGAQNVGGQTTGTTSHQKEVVASTSKVKAKKKKAVKKAVKKQEGQKTEQQPKAEGSQTK